MIALLESYSRQHCVERVGALAPAQHGRPAHDHVGCSRPKRELPGQVVVSLAYVGAKGTYVDLVGLNINQAVPGPGAVVTRRPYPNLSDTTGVVPWTNEMYQSMQTTFERRFSSVRFSGSWTWAHSIDESSGESSGSPVQNPRNLAAQRGSSTFDVRHKFTLAASWDLPFGHGKRYLTNAPRPLEFLAGGWQLNSITSLLARSEERRVGKECRL